MPVREVIVVGAGIAGAATAFFLAERGVRTTLIERWRPAGGPTGRSSALTHAFYLQAELSQLAARGVEILRRVPELTGEDAVHYPIGMMWVCGADAAPAWRASAERIQGEGSRIDILSPADFAGMAPGFALDGIALALWEPDYGYADAYRATNALAKGARDRGVACRFDTRVARLATAGGRIAGVETESGEKLAADAVVVAAGPWTRPLVAAVGCDLPLHVERHAMAVLEAAGHARELLPFAWCDDLLCSYARPDGDRVVLVGTWAGGGTGIRHDSLPRPARVADPDHFDDLSDAAEAAGILELLTPRLPRLEPLGIRPGYACVYDMSPDDNPIIDRVPGVDGLFVVCGSSGHGFKMGAGVGEAVARLVATGESPLLQPFGLGRFAR